MNNSLPAPKNGKLPPPPQLTKAARDERLREVREAIHEFLEAHKTDNSERAYYAGLRYFWAWCWYTWGVTEEAYPVPEPLIEAYVIGQLKGFRREVDEVMIELGIKKTPNPSKLSTIEQRLWSLNRAHQEHVKDIGERYVYTQAVRQLLKSARKDARHRKEKSKALVRDLLMELIDALDDMEPIYATMMRAMLSVGFAAGADGLVNWYRWRRGTLPVGTPQTLLAGSSSWRLASPRRARQPMTSKCYPCAARRPSGSWSGSGCVRSWTSVARPCSVRSGLRRPEAARTAGRKPTVMCRKASVPTGSGGT